ncbi:RNA polymerase I-specific transcription initiation factor RRN3-domain-containing protein [Lipomyces orientalis]|uniref:RNA polymerase I-specific transcription initiation factor RRN3-domain-containing protein n=1 Tax=Lipomyces orientalis TaxID=1233043 RepID=A0ACC3TLS8_9ASCO
MLSPTSSKAPFTSSAIQPSKLKRKRPEYDPITPSSSSASDSGDDSNIRRTLSHQRSGQQQRKKRVTTSAPAELERNAVAFGNSDQSSAIEATVAENDFSATPAKSHGLAGHIHRGFVQNALSEMDKGNITPLLELTSQLSVPLFSPEGLSAGQVYYTLSALLSHIDRLSATTCVSLIRAIINLPGIETDPASLSGIQRKEFSTLVELHGKFLGVLVSSIPRWYAEVASRIVSEFTMASGWSAERWHALLRYLVTLVPTSAAVLQSAIIRLFPYKYEDLGIIARYVANILRVLEYVPELQRAVWGVIVERTVELDVDIESKLDQLDDEDEDNEEDDGEAEWNKLASLSRDSNLQLEGKYHEDEVILSTQLAAEAQDVTNVKTMSIKLDSLVSFLLGQLKPSFSSSGVPSKESLSLYSTLLSLFTTYLIPTHRTHAIQYLFFSVSQSAPEFTDAFLALLLETALAPTEAIPRRQMAMQYLASYVARARAVSRSQLHSVIAILSRWISRYLDERELEVPSADSTPLSNSARGNIDMARFTMFYAVVQGYFYIFCFRHAGLRNDEDESGHSGEWVCNISQLLQRIVNSRFNPLKWCNADVVSMFSKVAQREGTAYCFSIIQKNKRGTSMVSDVSTPIEGSTMSHEIKASSLPVADFDGVFQKMGMKQLEGYFPFDPLVLKKTRRLVEENYVTWAEVAADEDYSSDEEDEDDKDDKDNSEREGEDEDDEDDDGEYDEYDDEDED